jgi:hypothetical protein
MATAVALCGNLRALKITKCLESKPQPPDEPPLIQFLPRLCLPCPLVAGCGRGGGVARTPPLVRLAVGFWRIPPTTIWALPLLWEGGGGGGEPKREGGSPAQVRARGFLLLIKADVLRPCPHKNTLPLARGDLAERVMAWKYSLYSKGFHGTARLRPPGCAVSAAGSRPNGVGCFGLRGVGSRLRGVGAASTRRATALHL